MVLAPEHPLLTSLKDSITNWDEVATYRAEAGKKKEIERTAEGKEKTGVELKGITAVNPANNEKIPVFIADYVLAHYGTGAIMAVPAHDERDFAFAKKYNLPIPYVVYGGGSVQEGWTLDKYSDEWNEWYSKPGKLINSGRFDGLTSEEAKAKIVEHVGGKVTKTYKLRDWVFSRQRYWGEPIPVIHCEKCGVVPVPYDELPVRLPEVENYAPTGTGESPLADIHEWVNVTCPTCGGAGKRETNTMPQWAGSSWYYLRFIDPHNADALIDPEKEKSWAPVDVYVGGDHAVRHLIYARFWHKFLYDIGVVSTIEPFSRLEFLGFILAEDGRKMSKRWGNIINPTEIVEKNGADTLRVYEMFMGPFENTIAWNTEGLVGAQRFLDRVYGLRARIVETESIETTILLNETIQKVSQDIELFKFNTAISALMIFLNQAEKEGLSSSSYEIFLQLIAPFAPHLTEELWSISGKEFSIHQSAWPSADTTVLQKKMVTVAVQYNGKSRGVVLVPLDSDESVVREALMGNTHLANFSTHKTIKKTIFVPNRIINILVE